MEKENTFCGYAISDFEFAKELQRNGITPDVLADRKEYGQMIFELILKEQNEKMKITFDSINNTWSMSNENNN